MPIQLDGPLLVIHSPEINPKKLTTTILSCPKLQSKEKLVVSLCVSHPEFELFFLRAKRFFDKRAFLYTKEQFPQKKQSVPCLSDFNSSWYPNEYYYVLDNKEYLVKDRLIPLDSQQVQEMPISSFNLTLTDKEREEREKVNLSYQIEYEFDAEDDYDSDDPDADLEI